MISSSRFYSIINSLKAKGFLKEHTLTLGGRGSLTTFLEITPSGCEAIGVKKKAHLSRGGNFITDVFVQKLSDNLRKILTHCKVSLEKQVQGKFCDIVIEGVNQSFIIAVEVELSDANLKVNLEKDAEGADFVIEALVNEQLAKKAEEIVKAMPREKQIKIGICLLTKLMRCQKLSDVVDSDFLKERGL
jgi:hypothetical protein